MSVRAETVRLANEDGVLSVWLNRPEARNAVNLRMCEDLIEVFGSLRSEEAARVVVVRGSGPAFCAGVDIREFAARDAAWVLHRRSLGTEAYLAIEQCPLPVICAVHGAVIGAGCELAAACDFVVADETAFFQWPEALRGVVGATQRLPRAIHRSMAKELLFTSRRITAQDARAIGFVNHVAAPGGLDEAVQTRVREILTCRPMALRFMKQAINAGEALDRTAAVQMERTLIEQSLQHEEWREGTADFAPRR